MRSKPVIYGIQLLKVIVFLGALATVFKGLYTQQDLAQQFISFFGKKSIGTMIFVVMLSALNWGIEAKKWQLVVRQFERISFIQAFKATLAGSTISFILPKRVGEFLGRIVFINLNKVLATLLTLLASFSQTVITLTLGSIGLALFLSEFQLQNTEPWVQSTVWVLAILSGVLLVGFYFSVGPITSLLHPNNHSGKLKLFLRIARLLARVPTKTQAQILALSAIRYGVFSTQYFLLFHLAGLDLSLFDGFTVISTIYLLLAIVPSVALSELGIREALAVSVIAYYSSNTVGVVLASFGIWVINLALPATFGALFLLIEKLKLKGFTLFVQKPN